MIVLNGNLMLCGILFGNVVNIVVNFVLLFVGVIVKWCVFLFVMFL